MSVTIQRSTGTTLSSTINPMTARRMVEVGEATVVTPGTTGFDVVKLASAALDTAYGNATANNPHKIGVDNIRWTPLQYPEAL